MCRAQPLQTPSSWANCQSSMTSSRLPLTDQASNGLYRIELAGPNKAQRLPKLSYQSMKPCYNDV